METRANAIMNGAAAEHIREGIPVLASYCDALGVRAFAEGKNLEEDLGETLFGMIDALCDKPLINLESAVNHPCQALADWRTMDELEVPTRAKFVLSWVYHPQGAAPGGALRRRAHGRDARHGRGGGAPRGLRATRRRSWRRRAPAARASRRLGHARPPTARAALAGASVLYAKEWGSTAHYGDAEADARAARRLEGLVRARGAGSRSASPGARLMHCLPVRRNVAVADEVLDGARAVVKREAGIV